MSNISSVIVVGLGAAGSAALLSLASRGIPCIGIDRFHPPHNRGSSHGHSRLIRLCYYEHPDYVPLLIESYRLWNQLERRTGRRLLDITGGLYIGRRGDPFVDGSLRTAIERKLNHELLGAEQVRARFPAICIEDHETAFFEPTTGVLYPEECIRASLELAVKCGARIVTDARVLDVKQHSREVLVCTEQSSFRAQSVVLAAGAWIPQLLPELRANLRVSRQVLAWFRPSHPERLSRDAMPAWSVSREDGSAFYGFPMMEQAGADTYGGEGFKVALHAPGPETNPEFHHTEVHDSEVEVLRSFLQERFRDSFDDHIELLHARACMYTSTPDHHFLIDRHPVMDRVVVVSACSGHGFKMSPAIGSAAADLATTAKSSLPIQFLSWRQPFAKSESC